MGSYHLKYHPKKPEGIENKKAYLVGSGIATLAAAFYLIRDGHMDGKNITIFERKNVNGGALDGAGNFEDGYIIRGGREMEEHYECTWDLFGDIPTLEDPERTVLDDMKEINDWDPNVAAKRVIQNRGEKVDTSTLGLKEHHIKQLTKLFLAKEEDLGDLTVEQFFTPDYLETNMWLLWRSMFAFQPWHSVVEMKRYMERFIHLLPGMTELRNILFSRYNQYDSFVLPLVKWLKDHGVKFENNTLVTDLDIEINEKEKVVTGIHIVKDGKEQVIKTTRDDLVFVINGSMTENSTLGSMDKAPELNRELGPVWSLWKNIAAKDPAFGRPEVFYENIDKTKWESFTVTFKDSKMADVIKEITNRDPYSGRVVTGGIITIKDSNWGMSFTFSRQPHFANQPDDVLVMWAYGLFADNEGDYIKKKMSECTGEELLRELLYHIGVEGELMEEIVDSAIVIPAMMPHITSQFMPRVKGDRPEVVPEGSVNLAFLGQFVEIKDDCVFTVEYSVRSAVIAVYKLLNLDKEVPEIYPSKYDIRHVINATKTLYGNKPLPGEFFVKKLLKDTSLEGLI
ncbi:oleate hydratase [Marinitoga sp. 1135]|uniref:Myosin-crossreactive antigen n=1 Tax=Marinitoga piezophila (strain DSM 14283 / JCM 11233 / KA3) TaxID=443254 RepID=H2J7C1_MARPK|nr:MULTISPECIES: oleate hydratase [Marinitoga]AEX85313.1 myosin-crossreactive antigen [Marinitoga piezophila KA3]APT75798.1 oleate hydratase [Marinitoga sp. 1137]NUU95536.1 oleate hydratase [Marinitoga sp. 1135]NUU97464.1 oleate hydratase [Marinitoga sp. 1138]